MKKLFLFSMLAFSLLSVSMVLNAQNIVVNGDLESWTAGEPDGWTKAENISQETTLVHGGSSSAKHTSESSTKDFQQILSGIQEGTEYTISYWYYDNDPSARTRLWCYWRSGTNTLPDNEEILRPSTYSEDIDAWQEFNVTLTAPATADGFQFEVRVYNQEGNIGGSVFYDDFEFNGDVVINPEPSNYPTAFAAMANGLAIDLSWTDATGANLPSKYIILAGTSPSLPMPVDGTPISDDTDLSDGSGALNVAYGLEEASFGNLDANTTYYFSIYPYSNAGPNIDYKTDGTAPTANDITANLVIIESENFDDSWGNWTTISVVGDEVWDRDNTYGIGNTPCARMNGYNGGPVDNDDWLISPALNLDNYYNETLEFFNAKNYEGPDMECKISTDYDGGGDPYSANWTSVPYTLTPGNWTWTSSGIIDLSGYSGTAVYIAFQYTSNTSESATWEVDDIMIAGEEDAVIDPEPSNYPTAFEANAIGTSIMLSWDDATGTQLPDAYIIFAGTTSSLPTPADGTPVPNDTDLSDGSGALNVVYGLEEAMFSGLEQGSTYYFAIYPYTNNGVNIDFKTDGVAPTTNALVPITPEPTNYPMDFEAIASISGISLTWTDASGAQLPDAYIIYAGLDVSLPVPVDGTPVVDDLDLSDGTGAINIVFGVQETSFAGLDPETTYYFSIYPYTNSGALIDFKMMELLQQLKLQHLNLQLSSLKTSMKVWGGWTTISITGPQVWDRDNTYGINNTPCAKMSGYAGGAVENEDWLISPQLNLTNFSDVVLTFFNAMSYDGDVLQLKVSTDYSGSGDPNALPLGQQCLSICLPVSLHGQKVAKLI
ncbi:MAG: choice-of-anchor J domain-containing protein [Bacteroidales bacterium]